MSLEYEICANLQTFPGQKCEQFLFHLVDILEGNVKIGGIFKYFEYSVHDRWLG